MATVRSDQLPVLLVEGSPSARARVQPVLPAGASVALDAEGALEAVRRQSFAAIVLAQDLAGRSGLDVLHELRARGDETPVILMTPEGEEGLRETALRAGAAACLVKEEGFETALPALLARATVRRETAVRRGDVLVFELAGRTHGLFAEDVELVSQAVAIMPLPGAPRGIEGLIDVQGDLLPVLDLRSHLGLAAREPDPDEHMVVVRARRHRVAIRVDRATALARVEPGDLESGTLLPDTVAAVARLEGELVPIHDPATFASQAAWAYLTRGRAGAS
jgi:purine-binding chemotaxis protein CheW